MANKTGPTRLGFALDVEVLRIGNSTVRLDHWYSASASAGTFTWAATYSSAARGISPPWRGKRPNWADLLGEPGRQLVLVANGGLPEPQCGAHSRYHRAQVRKALG